MRIGFAGIYSWRPHVEQLFFLSKVAERGGHTPFFLTCDADLPTCYTRELRGRPGWLECLQCRAGGIRSFARRRVSAIGKLQSHENSTPEIDPRWSESSASTLGRFESNADFESAEFRDIAQRLEPAVDLSYRAAKRWIEEAKLDAVCVFNGRIDATRAIFEAAKAAAIRVLSVERSWFGDGLQLHPDENCLGLKSVHSLVSTWRERPLTSAQARRAASHLAARFLKTNVSEWRAYNRNAVTVPWPVPNAKRRVLLVPSSRNEVWGQPDWEPSWPGPTEAYDGVIAALGLDARDLVLRCHPNWGEMIGHASGERSERVYAEWSAARGIHCIRSTDTTSTLSLIEQCEAIVVAHGSAAVEAGILGKQVIGTGPSSYQEAGFRDAACVPQDLNALRLHSSVPDAERAVLARENRRRALRYMYTMVYRMTQYVDFVKAESTTRFRYDLTADPARLTRLLESGRLVADDESWAPDEAEENAVLELIGAGKWTEFIVPSVAATSGDGRLVHLRRRWSSRHIDLLSAVKPVGDR